MAEAAALLVNIKELTVEAANSGALSAEEIRANQLQVDSAIDSITRIANATTFAGLHLLNGHLSYSTSAVATSAITSLGLHSAQLGTQSYLSVKVSGVLSAQRGQLEFNSATIGNSVTLEIASNRGVEVFSFVSGTRASTIMSAINAVTQAIGVVASTRLSGAAATSGVMMRSVDYGSDAFVSVRALPTSNGTFTTYDIASATRQRDTGRDIQATVNGANTVGDGQSITFNSGALDLTMKLDAQFGAGNTSSFYVTGGGAMFQVGPHINISEQVSLGIDSVAASNLGSSSAGGFLNEVATGGAYSLVSGNTLTAAEIIEQAIDQVSILRGRLGAFERNTLDTNINSLRITLENVTSAESAIRDADFAAETAALTRAQILVNAGTSVLSIANAAPQAVLSLLQ